jgi:integrase
VASFRGLSAGRRVVPLGAASRRRSPVRGAHRDGAADRTSTRTLLRERGIPEIVHCTPHTLRRSYISLLLAGGCDPANVMAQVGTRTRR